MARDRNSLAVSRQLAEMLHEEGAVGINQDENGEYSFFINIPGKTHTRHESVDIGDAQKKSPLMFGLGNGSL